jgi:hypothetical protein
MKNIFNIFKIYFFVKDNISYLLLVLNKCFNNNNNNNNLKHKQSNDFLSENNLKIISSNNCYICDKNLINNNNNELEQENVILINPKIYLAYDKIFCSPMCRNYFLINI